MFYSFLTYAYLFFISLFPLSSWTHGMQKQPVSFLPYEASTDTELTVSNILFRKLVNVDPKTGEVGYDLMESYEVKEDGLVYEIKLKENQYWHDGIEITSDDLLYTASLSPNLKEVSSDKIDEYKVRFILPNKYSPFINILSIPISPSHLGESNKKLLPIGSGDYRPVRLGQDRAIIEELVLVSLNDKNPFKKLIFRFYETDDDLRIAAKLKEVDSILFEKVENFEGYNRKKYIFEGRSYLLVFNTSKEYLTKEVRTNIVRSIDFNSLLSEQQYDEAVRPFGPFSGTWAASGSFEQYEYDEEVNLSNDLNLTLVIPKTNQAHVLASNVKNDLEEKGLSDLDIEELETEDYVLSVRENDYDMVLLAQEYGFDPDRFVFWHSSQNKTGLNFSNFSSIRTDKSLEEGRAAESIEVRKDHYDIFQSVFFEEVPAIYLVHPTQHFYYSNKVTEIPDFSYYYPWQVFNNIDKWKLQKANILM